MYTSTLERKIRFSENEYFLSEIRESFKERFQKLSDIPKKKLERLIASFGKLGVVRPLSKGEREVRDLLRKELFRRITSGEREIHIRRGRRTYAL